MYRPVRRSVAAVRSVLIACCRQRIQRPSLRTPTADIDAATLVPDGIVGPSQAGDLASDPALAWLTDEECAAAKEQGFRIGIVMQTMNIEWSTEQVRGITDGLARCGGEVIAGDQSRLHGREANRPDRRHDPAKAGRHHQHPGGTIVATAASYRKNPSRPASSWS